MKMERYFPIEAIELNLFSPHSPPPWFPQTVTEDVLVALLIEDSEEFEIVNELAEECDDFSGIWKTKRGKMRVSNV